METSDKFLEIAGLGSLNLYTQFMSLSSLINIIFAALIGFLIIGIYAMTSDRGRRDFSLIQSVPVLSMLMAVIMRIDSSRAVMFFGIFGILSIVRFRSELTDQKGITFILFSIIMGLLAGIGQFLLAIISFFIIGFVIFIIHFIFLRTRYRTAKVVVRGNEGVDIIKTIAEKIFDDEIQREELANDTMKFKCYDYISCSQVRAKNGEMKREIEYLLHFHHVDDVFIRAVPVGKVLGVFRVDHDRIGVDRKGRAVSNAGLEGRSDTVKLDRLIALHPLTVHETVSRADVVVKRRGRLVLRVKHLVRTGRRRYRISALVRIVLGQRKAAIGVSIILFGVS